MSKFSFNGILIDDLEIRRGFAIPTWSYHEIDSRVIPGRHGVMQTGRRMRSRPIPVPVQLEFKDETDLAIKKERIAFQLISKTAKELKFDIEPERKFFGIVEGPLNLNERDLNVAFGVINFICHNPFKYALDERVVNLTQVTNNVHYGGTQSTPNWRIEATVGTATNHITIGHENSESQVVVNWNFQPGDFVIIDGATEMIIINNNSQMTSLNWENTQWFELEPGNNVITRNILLTTLIFTERWI